MVTRVFIVVMFEVCYNRIIELSISQSLINIYRNLKRYNMESFIIEFESDSDGYFTYDVHSAKNSLSYWLVM